MAKMISLNEVRRRTNISYPALLRYRDRMLFKCPSAKDGEWCGPLAKFAEVTINEVGVFAKFDPAAIPLFLREKRSGLAKRGRPPKPSKERGR